jgi:hypothetical protein
MPKLDNLPDTLRPYQFHGMYFHESGQWAIGDCPFCGKEGKFHVSIREGTAGCFSCIIDPESERGGVNPTTFLRRLWVESSAQTKNYQGLRADRGLLEDSTLETWGAVQSVLTGDWMIPGFNGMQDLVQLYSYRKYLKHGMWSMRLFPTPGLDPGRDRHGLFGAQLFKEAKPEVCLCEGPWDGMAYWEAIKAKGDLEVVNVMAVPGCTTFLDSWLPLFSGKKVGLLYDSDHPLRFCPRCKKSWSSVTHKTCQACATDLETREHFRGGIAGMERVARALATPGKAQPADEVYYLRWGDHGYDPDRKDGYDVRDLLMEAGDTLEARVLGASVIADMMEPAKPEWIGSGEATPAKTGGRTVVTPLPCSSWSEVLMAWRRALQWREGLEDFLAALMAVAFSRPLAGEQLFLQGIGDAGSGKTTMCKGLLISRHCWPVESLTGFYSGVKDQTGKDYSLLAEANHKCWVTPEADLLMSSPKFIELLSQSRRIFDGEIVTRYKNQDEKRYPGLRTPWVMAGTHELLNLDQSRVGDRFIKVYIEPPTHEARRDILIQTGNMAWNSCSIESNCNPESSVEPLKLNAQRLTAGYLDHLLSQPIPLIDAVKESSNRDRLVGECAILAEMTACLRCRPCPDPKRDIEPRKELPSRLQNQYIRLALCLACATQEKSVNRKVMRRVQKIAIDTAHGFSQKTAQVLYEEERKNGLGAYSSGSALLVGMGEERHKTLLSFLADKEIDVVEYYKPDPHINQTRWRLTRRFRKVWEQVLKMRKK